MTACAVSTSNPESMKDQVTSPLLETSLEVPPSVSLRDETFGALAYNFTTRQLTFLKSRALTSVVRNLDGRKALRDVLEECDVPKSDWGNYSRALSKLVESRMLVATERTEER